ncbi:MAG TPA: hypothetical protein VMV96_03885 [Acidimicrobiales bacterium]|nr:hypothetical protein [Acidimicrobiales bacterium]
MKRPARPSYAKFTQWLLVFVPVALLGWMIYLLTDLPVSYRAQNWDIAWIGYDFAMLMSLSTTAWAFWNRRQLAIPAAVISATFLVVDAWFDVVTSQRGFDLDAALISAFVVELPLATYLIHFSRRAIRYSIRNAQMHAGLEVVTISLVRTPLALFDGPPPGDRRSPGSVTRTSPRTDAGE